MDDFLTRTRKRFPDGPGPALYTGYDELDSALKLFTATAPAPAPAFAHSGLGPQHPVIPFYADFASALLAAAGRPSTRSEAGTCLLRIDPETVLVILTTRYRTGLAGPGT